MKICFEIPSKLDKNRCMQRLRHFLNIQELSPFDHTQFTAANNTY